MRHKHSHELTQLNNNIDQLKKAKAAAEKSKGQFEADLADMANELKSITGNKQEAERRRKQLESQVNFVVVVYHYTII